MTKGVFNANTGHFAGMHIWSMAIGGIVGVTCGGLISKQNILVERDFKPLPAFPEFRRAVCFLRPVDKESKAWGYFVLSQADSEQRLKISGKIHNLSPGEHGMQIRCYGDITKGIETTGPIYNPFRKKHGAKESRRRMVGSLGNVEADENNEAKVFFTDWLPVITGRESIIGRSITIHEFPDDNGAVNKIDGGVGRVLCGGVIGIANPDEKIFTHYFKDNTPEKDEEDI